MTKFYNERRTFSKDGFDYLLDDDDHTAWITHGRTGRKRVYTLPDTVDVNGVIYTITSAELYAFSGSNKLEEIIVPDSYEYLDDGVFMGRESIKRIYLGKGLEMLHYSAIHPSPSLEVTIDKDNPNLKMSDDGSWILSKDGKYLIASIKDKEELTVPEGVVTIGSGGFFCLKHLRKMFLPNSLRVIRVFGVFGNRSLVHLELPEGLEIIQSQGIVDNGMESLTLPSSLKQLDLAMLEGDIYVKELTVLCDPSVLPPDKVGFMVDANIPKDDCILRVPAKRIEDFKAHPAWSMFKTIIPLN